MTTALLAGLALGVAGSAHCVLMCGPLVLAVNGGTRSAHGAYHAGRMAVYAALGLAAGAVGMVAGSGGLGRTLSVTAGLAMLVAATGRLLPLTAPATRWWSRGLSRSSAAVAGLGRRRPLASRLLAGALNGLLPCGLVTAAVVAAAATGSPWHGGVLMAGFGAGTWPALALLPLAARRLPNLGGAPLRRLVPVALALTGALLIVRGLAPPVGHDDHAAAAEHAVAAAPHHH